MLLWQKLLRALSSSEECMQNIGSETERFHCVTASSYQMTQLSSFGWSTTSHQYTVGGCIVCILNDEETCVHRLCWSTDSTRHMFSTTSRSASSPLDSLSAVVWRLTGSRSYMVSNDAPAFVALSRVTQASQNRLMQRAVLGLCTVSQDSIDQRGG